LLSWSRNSVPFMEPTGACLVCNSPLLDSNLSQMNPVHILIIYYLRYILMLSSHLGLCLLSSLCPSRFSTKIVYAFLEPSCCYIYRKISGRWEEKSFLIFGGNSLLPISVLCVTNYCIPVFKIERNHCTNINSYTFFAHGA